MAKQQGKIISVPIHKVKEGMQVVLRGKVFNNTILINTKSFTDGIQRIGIPIKQTGISTKLLLAFNGTASDYILKVPLEECKALVVDFTTDLGTILYPLKYSQWQSAIDNDEVDTGRLVDFVVVTNSESESNKSFTYAKIIPTKVVILDKEDKFYLMWLYDKLKEQYKEDPNTQDMLKLKSIIGKLPYS